eukprot:4925990-Prymnesium_polylepis.1
MLHLDARTCGDDPRDTHRAPEAQRLDTHARPQESRTVCDATPWSSGLQTAFAEKTAFFLLTDLAWAILHGVGMIIKGQKRFFHTVWSRKRNANARARRTNH